jgi:anthranilate/para-aminobenzoate synthase component II
MLDKMFKEFKIYIVDFDDSFTFNIANSLYPFLPEIEVINHRLFFERSFFKNLKLHKSAVILGPGPGHPDQYKKYFKQIKKLLNNSKIHLMGICLGHQLISRQLGYRIIPSSNCLHGEKIILSWKKKNYIVQRYNSLAVKPMGNNQEVLCNNEVMILGYKNGQSFQFHPESVGTENPLYFFKDLLAFATSL